ncbi:hypothetical protein PMI41_02841 [Phyllobacterium sp. YR531]|nr:hypothetical protein PMI41_02841 [Phyllobacterium sp. YR531]
MLKDPALTGGVKSFEVMFLILILEFKKPNKSIYYYTIAKLCWKKIVVFICEVNIELHLGYMRGDDIVEDLLQRRK